MCEVCLYPRDLQSGLHPKLGIENPSRASYPSTQTYRLQKKKMLDRRWVSNMVPELTTYRGDSQFIGKDRNPY